MNKRILCPTYKRAVYEWERFQKMLPGFWINVTKQPLTLTSMVGTTYYFEADNTRDVLGTQDALYIDEFVWELEKEIKDERDKRTSETDKRES